MKASPHTFVREERRGWEREKKEGERKRRERWRGREREEERERERERGGKRERGKEREEERERGREKRRKREEEEEEEEDIRQTVSNISAGADGLKTFTFEAVPGGVLAIAVSGCGLIIERAWYGKSCDKRGWECCFCMHTCYL